MIATHTPEEARETLKQLHAYTVDVQKFLGIDPIGGAKNYNGVFTGLAPNGFVFHYTASNRAQTKKRKYGRLPVLLERFKPGSSQNVGVPFIVWDEPFERFKDMKHKYPLIRDVPAEVFFMGDDLSFWHAGFANDWALGVEIRNVGQIQRKSDGVFYWNRGQHRYRGRPPIKIGQGHWEPYTKSQMVGALWVLRLSHSVHNLRKVRVLGHEQVSSTRIDPGLHFPIHEMRQYAMNSGCCGIPLLDVSFLNEFDDRGVDYDEEFISEESLHQGLYRHDWDGVPDDIGVETVYDFTKEHVEDVYHDDYDQNIVMQAKRDLRSCGYYIGEDIHGGQNKAFIESIRLFQQRWKVRMPNRRHRQELKTTGILDKPTLAKLALFVKQHDRR